MIPSCEKPGLGRATSVGINTTPNCPVCRHRLSSGPKAAKTQDPALVSDAYLPPRGKTV